MGVPVLARQHPRARQRGRGRPESPGISPLTTSPPLSLKCHGPRAPSRAGMPAVSFLVWEGGVIRFLGQDGPVSPGTTMSLGQPWLFRATSFLKPC